MFHPRVGLLVCAILSLVLFQGCGKKAGKYKIVKVTGKITYKDKAVADANVVFTPEDGPAATGKTDSEGKFTLTTKDTGDGAVVGKHKIAITTGGQAGEIKDVTDPDGYAPPEAGGKETIPPKYQNAETSGLTRTVEESGENDFNIELKDD